jgi:hypothetical protein
MSSDFVRYSPEIETIDPDLDEYSSGSGPRLPGGPARDHPARCAARGGS